VARRQQGVGPQYPRIARVNALLREVVAEELRRLGDLDIRLRMVTVTGVDTDRDLRHARVYVASLPETLAEALAEHRRQLQAAIGSQVRMRHTPTLDFVADPAVEAAERLESLLRRHRDEHEQAGGTE
jgi:ribosome-binding factor A